jgi:hypothetical protein
MVAALPVPAGMAVNGAGVAVAGVAAVAIAVVGVNCSGAGMIRAAVRSGCPPVRIPMVAATSIPEAVGVDGAGAVLAAATECVRCPGVMIATVVRGSRCGVGMTRVVAPGAGRMVRACPAGVGAAPTVV